MKTLLLLCCLLLAGCDTLPRDPEGTMERVTSEKAFDLGLIEGEGSRSDDAAGLVERVSRATGARPRVETGGAEPLLLKLEAGELDLVVGAMSAKSPWAMRVHVLPPLDGADGSGGPVELVAMTRNGENRWIQTVHREVMAMRANP